MKTKHILALLAVVAVAIVGCSSILPAPQIVITKVDPFSVSSDSANITVSMVNMNHVDAIILHSRYTFKGVGGIDQSPIYSHSAYVPGNVDTVKLVCLVTGLTAVRTTLGSPVTMWMKFWGTDVGNNKSFVTDSVAVNCN
jgi:hypothetical protein